MFILEILYTSLYLLLSISSNAAQNECDQKCSGAIAKKNNLGTYLSDLTYMGDVNQSCIVYGDMMDCLEKDCALDSLPEPIENTTNYRNYIKIQLAKYTGVMKRCSDPEALIQLNICRRSERFKEAVKDCLEEPNDWRNATDEGAKGIAEFCSDELNSLECRIKHSRIICNPNATKLWIESTRAGFKKLVEINPTDLIGSTPQNCTLLYAFLDKALKNECEENCDIFIRKKNGLGTYLSNLTDVVDVERSCSVYGEMMTCLNNPESHCDPDVMPTPAENMADYRTYIKIIVAKYTGVMKRCSDPGVLTELNICRRSEMFKKAVESCTEEQNEWGKAIEYDAKDTKSFCSDELKSLQCRIQHADTICSPNAKKLWLESTRAGFKKLIEIKKLKDDTCKGLFEYLDKGLPEHPVPSPGGTTSITPASGNVTPNTTSPAIDPASSEPTSMANTSSPAIDPASSEPASSEPTSMAIKHTSEDVLAIGLTVLANLVISSLGLLALKA